MTNFFIFLRRSLQLIITLLSLLIATFAILLCLAMSGCPIVQAEPISSDYDPVPLVVYETLIYEGASTGIEGMMNIAKVIRTRAEERHQTFTEVVLAPKQFSCFYDKASERVYEQYELNMAKEAWYLSNYVKDDMNLYHDTRVLPYWAKDSRVKFVKQIDNLMFYYERR